MRKLLKNNWVVTVIGGVLSVLALRIIDSLFINDFLWDSIKSGFNGIVNFLNTDYTVKLYFLILLPIIFMAVVIGIILLIAAIKDKGDVSAYPEWKVYTKDVFGGIQYRWQYDFIGKRYDIVHLQRFCDKCSCHLVDNKCPVCGENHSYNASSKSQEEVHALIARNIDTGLYKNSPYFKA